MDANSCINLSIKALCREKILGLVPAARTNSLSIFNRKRAETVFLTGSWTTQAQRSILILFIILRHKLAQLRHWKPDENGPCNQQISCLWMSCMCTKWLCMTGNDLELHQFLLLSEFKQDLVTNLFRLRQFWAASKTSKQLENSGIK